MTERKRQPITIIPHTDSEETLDMSADELGVDSDDAEKIAEALDAGCDVEGLDIENPVHRAGILMHVQAAIPDELR